jgi:flagellin
MGLRINQNIAAMNSYRNLSVTDSQMAKSLEKLSSGFRINRAADDAAGLSVSEGLRAQVGGLKVAVRNAQDGISVVQTAEGALTEVHSILQRMRDLGVQASNSGSQDLTARQAAQTELAQLNSELDRIGKTTSFGASKLLDGTFGLQGATTVGNSGATQVTGTTATTVAAADVLTITLGTTTAAGAAGTDIVGLVTMVNTGAAATAGSITNDAAGATALQTALQADIDASASLAKGLVTASVKYDSLTNKLSVNFTRTTATSANDDIAVGATSAGVKLGMAVTTTAPTGSGGGFQVGANNTSNDRITVAIGKVDSATLSTSTIDLTTSAAAAIDTIDAAIKTVSTTRANLGAYQNRFEHAINNLNVAVENLSASESRIRDTDMAQEMVAFTRSQILSQAGTSMLAQANQAPQSVLSLLR